MDYINNNSTDSKQDLEFNVNGVKFIMKYVEGGSFMMGVFDNDDKAYDREKPSHKVHLDSYYIGETQVTQALWQAVMGNNPSYWIGDKLPVETVSWDDCQKFIKKLNVITGKNFALPTEAQWEFAARGGNKSRGFLYSGSNNINDVAWYDDNSRRQTHQVATKMANELGLYDMTGNVWEWCNDWFDENYYSNLPQVDPKGPSSGDGRVLRGGCWHNIASGCRVSYRYGSNIPVYSFENGSRSGGLRLVLNLASKDIEFNVNGVKFTMKYVEGGEFMMGALDSDDVAMVSEKPSHKVRLDSYYMGETQVTQILWEVVMGENPSYCKGSRLPVDMVSWHDCHIFINKLNRITGRTFALPTEAQWEYAARGGKKSNGYLYSGSNDLDEVAWYQVNSNNKTHEVATKRSNELGLYDLSGNVREWCKDWYNRNYYLNSPQDNPQGPCSGKDPVLRGGCCATNVRSCRVYARGVMPLVVPGGPNRFSGFRLVLLD